MKSVVSTFLSSQKHSITASQSKPPSVQNFRKHVVHYTNHKTASKATDVTNPSSSNVKPESDSINAKNWRSSVPVAIQNLLYMYTMIHDLKDQIHHSVEHAEEEWQKILYGYYNPSSLFTTDSEDALLEFTFECKPEMKKTIRELKNCMDNMIPIENECLNVLEDVEDSVALSIKKTAWYKVHSKDLRTYLNVVRAEIAKPSSSPHVQNLLPVTPPSSMFSPMTLEHEAFHSSHRAEDVLTKGAFSLDQRSARLQKACQILSDMKKDENHSLHVIRQCLKQISRTSTHACTNPTSNNPSNNNNMDELDLLIHKIQAMLAEHSKILTHIRLLV